MDCTTQTNIAHLLHCDSMVCVKVCTEILSCDLCFIHRCCSTFSQLYVCQHSQWKAAKVLLISVRLHATAYLILEQHSTIGQLHPVCQLWHECQSCLGQKVPRAPWQTAESQLHRIHCAARTMLRVDNGLAMIVPVVTVHQCWNTECFATRCAVQRTMDLHTYCNAFEGRRLSRTS